jgi:hypothetical protein
LPEEFWPTGLPSTSFGNGPFSGIHAILFPLYMVRVFTIRNVMALGVSDSGDCMNCNGYALKPIELAIQNRRRDLDFLMLTAGLVASR